MVKYLIVGISLLCMFNIAAYAGPAPEKNTRHKEEIGLGLGAIIGGLIAGPPGAIIGAAGGAWFGDREQKEDTRLTELEKRLLEKQAELASLQDEFADMESRQAMEIRKVKQGDRQSVLDELSRGVSLVVYFRTNSSGIDSGVQPRIKRLAEYLQDFPEIQLHLDAHADRRGTEEYNRTLSRQRAKSVESALVNAGLNPGRIHSYAHGETRAKGRESDPEGYIFDRRVDLHLSLDSEVYAAK